MVKPSERKEDDEDKDKGKDEKPKSRTTTTTATHEDRVQKWVDVLDKAERLRDAKNDENGVSKEGNVERPIGVDNKEKSGKWTRTTDLSLRVVVGAVPDPRLFALDDPFAVAADLTTEERGNDDRQRCCDVREVYAVDLPLGPGPVHVRTETSDDKDDVLVVKPMSCANVNQTSSKASTVNNGVCVKTNCGTRMITAMTTTTTTTSSNASNRTTATRKTPTNWSPLANEGRVVALSPCPPRTTSLVSLPPCLCRVSPSTLERLPRTTTLRRQTVCAFTWWPRSVVSVVGSQATRSSAPLRCVVGPAFPSSTSARRPASRWTWRWADTPGPTPRATRRRGPAPIPPPSPPWSSRSSCCWCSAIWTGLYWAVWAATNFTSWWRTTWSTKKNGDNKDDDKSLASVLLGFLARFGAEELPTWDNVLQTEGNGEADLSRVYRSDNCVECFAKCHQQLTKERRNDNNDESLLCCVLNHEQL